MPLHVHRAERTDTLAWGLAATLSATPADAFAGEVVAVPTPGVERFLSQTLGRRLGTSTIQGSSGRASDGICANVSFPSPTALVASVLAAGGPDGPSAGAAAERGAGDPWQPSHCVWPLLATIDRATAEPWCQPLARHLGLDVDRGDGWDRRARRFATAARLASLFSSYASQRPQLVLDWAAGLDTDGAGAALEPDQAWQARLWRELRARIGTPSPAERLDAACRAVIADPDCVALPERLSVFGASRLPADQLRVLVALAAGRAVHLWLADACPALWTQLHAARAAAGARRAADTSATLVAHPLLRSLGRDSRELGLRLAPLLGEGGTDEHLRAVPPGATTTAEAAGATLLARLQEALRTDRPPGTVRAPMRPDDASIQVHGCHGPTRQVEVLREVILTRLADDPTLQPRDILVMCPDLTTFAPLIAAAFGTTGPGTPLADLRVRIADRTPEQSNEVLATLAVALDLVAGRVLRSEVLDLVSRGPVRARFGLDDDDLERLEALTCAAGARWGLDERTRQRFGLAGLPTGTWRWALDRLLLGTALSEDVLPVVGGVLPLDDVASSDVELVGALAEVVHQLIALRDAAERRAPLADWVAALGAAVSGLMDAHGPLAWQLPHALGALAELTQAAGDQATGPPLALPDVRWLLRDLLAGRPTRSNFRSGGLTVCGLLPMRSVPHRVVCLAGLDDGTFPRSPVADGDDVLARDPRVGERDPRSEDRQILLDAIMAATEHLVVTYTAADDRTNAPSPPCVPLGELLDALDDTAVGPDGSPAGHWVLRRHPLQPFDPRNFVAARPGEAPFSHDTDALAGARAGLQARRPAPGLEPAQPLPVRLPDPLEIGDLTRFLTAPAAEFLRNRIGLPTHREDEDASEALPVVLDGLTRWSVGERVLNLVVAGHPLAAVARAEHARGQLPPGPLGDRELRQIGPDAHALADQLVAVRGPEPAELVAVTATLPSGRRIAGGVGSVHGTRLVLGTYSRPGPQHLVRLWPSLLALAHTRPGRPWRAVVVGRGGMLQLAGPPADQAATLLDELVDLLAAGLATPLPLYPLSAHAYAQRRRDGRSVERAVQATQGPWLRKAGDVWIGEATSVAAQALLGPDAPVHRLLAEPPRPAEDWWAEEPSRFGRLARRLWQPILVAQDEAAAEQGARP